MITSNKYEVIKENEFGRRFTVRFKQYEYNEAFDSSNFLISRNGCDPTCIAIILASLSYAEDPISISKKMLFNEFGFLSDGYYSGINGVSMIYCLNKLMIDYKLDIEYEIVKINYNKPELMKNKIINMIQSGYMAIVNVGPGPNISSNEGHYVVVTSINKNNQEFYVANPWHDGDHQIDVTFSYEQIVKDIYKDNFDFLMIKKSDTEAKNIRNNRRH